MILASASDSFVYIRFLSVKMEQKKLILCE